MITLEEAQRRQDELQAEGHEILNHLGIKAKLSGIGRVRIDGSFAYGLMVKPDIDIEVIMEPVRISLIADLAKELITESKAEATQVVTRHLNGPRRPGCPRGVYMSLKPDYGRHRWNFDIWFHALKDRADSAFGPGWHHRLTPEQRNIILLLKYNLQELGRYPYSSNDPASFGSVDIYRAVMNDGIKTIEELDEWRKTNPFH